MEKNQYNAALESFDACVSEAIKVSQAIAGGKVASRLSWASILFTRLCNSCMSVLVIVPRSRLSRTDRQHWDFSAVASLIRNLIECYFTFFYLVIDPTNNEEWRCRLTVMELHDYISRLKMFRDFESDDEQLQKFEQLSDELTQQLVG